MKYIIHHISLRLSLNVPLIRSCTDGRDICESWSGSVVAVAALAVAAQARAA